MSCVRFFLTLAGLAICFTKLADAAEKAAETVSFERDIRPILSDKCFACHGPDAAARKAKLRLDRIEDAVKPASSGYAAVVPGDPANSELVARITATDEDDLMPPPSSGKKLSKDQIELLRRWVEQGAKWQTHWAFAAPMRPAVPEVQDTSWPRNPIDNFVLSRLEKEQLKPSPEAGKPALIRRASLDATGLPPTVDEVEALLADGSPEAYDRVVDRLLTMSRFGEHQARYWMDSVRYADTHGYHIDSQRDMWKYRDWVIDAFNQNKTFEQFTTEQLAGDLLPNPSEDQKIASGYVRANMTTGEGGAIEEEYRAKYTFDRVETTGTIFMGMTLVCARCHTHKYDAIQHREYYSLYAVFNQMADPVMDENKPNPAPFMKVPDHEQRQRLDRLREHVQAGEGRTGIAMPELDQRQSDWERMWHDKLTAGWAPLQVIRASSSVTNGAELEILEDRSVVVDGPKPEADTHELVFRPESGLLSALRLEVLGVDGAEKSVGRAPDGTFWLSELEAELQPPHEEGKETKPQPLKFARAVADAEAKEGGVSRALDGDAKTGWQVPASAASEQHAAVFVLKKPVSIQEGAELKLRLRYEAAKTNATLSRFRVSAAREGELARWLHPAAFTTWQVLGPLKAGDAGAALRDVYDPEKEIDLKKKFPGVREEVGWSERGDLEDGKANLLVADLHGVHGVRYLHRTITLSGSRSVDVDIQADGLFKLWLNGELAGERDHEQAPGEGPLAVTLHLREGENRLLLKLVTIQGASYFTFRPDLGSADGLTAEIAAILATSPQRTSANEVKLRSYYRRQHSPDFKKDFDALVRWREELESVERAVPTTLIGKDSEKPVKTHILLRGEYDKQGDEVQPGVPSIFPPFPEGAPKNRLGLAQWLLNPSHPLTSRVVVNRLWHQYFGIGLVKTLEDFGMQGEHPSHPELLDWLATEFISSGWDMKHMHRLILTSATYRQTAQASRDLIARDPENRLLARGPRFRADAEVVRDTALYLGGLLVEDIGGRSVRPYEPPGLWEAVSFNNSQKYIQDDGPAQYRRSLYTFWKRQSPPPTMLLFDAPTREFCTVRRSRSNTPLQALALLNDPQFVEAARAFAQRVLLEGGASVDSRASYAFQLASSRRPDPEELAVLRRIFTEQLEVYKRNPKAAEQFLAVGSFTARADLDPAELAAWATVASLIFNLDETLTKS